MDVLLKKFNVGDYVVYIDDYDKFLKGKCGKICAPLLMENHNYINVYIFECNRIFFLNKTRLKKIDKSLLAFI